MLGSKIPCRGRTLTSVTIDDLIRDVEMVVKWFTLLTLGSRFLVTRGREFIVRQDVRLFVSGSVTWVSYVREPYPWLGYGVGVLPMGIRSPG